MLPMIVTLLSPVAASLNDFNSPRMVHDGLRQGIVARNSWT